MTQVRPAAVAGSFYPGDSRALRAAVDGHLGQVGADAAAPAPKLLVVPHAGYIYSGAVAASAYALLAPARGRIRHVVLLGPAHRVAVRGLAAPAAEAFETPLGRVPIDRAALARISGLAQVSVSDRPHALEHALEVQLPFLQTVLGDGFCVLPLVVGEARPHEVDEVLERLWGGDETLIVVSTDLSHYLPYADARVRDRHTMQRILAFASDLRGDEACGAAALNGALITARRHGLVPRLLDLRNSGDTAGGDHDRVVGYGAFAFDASPAAAKAGETAAAAGDEPALGHALLAAARAEIAGALGLPAPAAPAHPDLERPGATFVTLRDAGGALRGCVGQLEARVPLGEDVRHNALAAAFGDRRFAPLTAAEWPRLQIEVSLLGPQQPLPAAADIDAAAALLQPGVDGVVLAWHGRRSTLLPQVWQDRPDGRGFLQALLQKAGLAPDFWSAEIRLSRYAVAAFTEPGDGRAH
jgi:hypothetical protein